VKIIKPEPDLEKKKLDCIAPHCEKLASEALRQPNIQCRIKVGAIDAAALGPFVK